MVLYPGGCTEFAQFTSLLISYPMKLGISKTTEIDAEISIT